MTMLNPETVVVVLSFSAVSIPLTYVLGLMFSRGFHRGKREYVHRLMTESIFDGKE